jgi:hypothetical protein
MENKSCFFIFYILLFPVSSFTQIKVIESTQSMVRLIWEIGGIDTAILGSGEQQSVMLSFKGQNTVVGSIGDVLLPGYSLFTGIPPAGEVEVSVVAEQVSSMKLVATPYVNKNGNPVSRQSFEFLSPWSSQPVYDCIRGIRTAAFIIRPAVYDYDTRELRIMTRGIITIKLPPGVQRSTIAGTSEFETILSQLLCNYPVATGWRTVPGALKKKKSSVAFPLDNIKVYHFRVGDGCKNEFNEVTTLENGLMKIPGSAIIDAFGVIPVSTVKLYASVKGELSYSVPDVDKIPDGVIEIPLLRVVGSNNGGMVDSDDFFIAYVTGASDWTYENGDFKMNVDRFDDYRNYWLTTGNDGSSMKRWTGKERPDTVIHHFVQPCYFKQSNHIPKESEGGLKRIWVSLTNGNTGFSKPLDLSGIDTTLPGNLRINYEIENFGSLKLKFGNIDEDSVNNNYQYAISSWSDQKVDWTFFAQTDSSYCEIHDMAINYFRKMDVPDHGSLTIFSMPEKLNYAYTISGIDNHLVYIVRVSESNEIELIDTVRGSSDNTFTWVDSGMSGARFIVCREDNLLPFPSHEEYRKSAVVKHSVHDLRNVSNQTDYLIITDSAFAVQAETLAVHKVKMGFTNPVVVDVRDIYRLFSGGDLDPAAIRNFVQYAKNRWVNGFNLDYVLLMGAGNYDYKQKIKSIPVHIPIYYNDNDELLDDYFSVTDPYITNPSPSCAIGRISCQSAREAAVMVQKIREYEDPELADFSAWRNRALFVADDDKQGDIDDPVRPLHNISSDSASQALNKKWVSLDLRKVFLYEYEWDSSRRKPGATRAIVNQINNGAGIVNYFGHGAYYLWADEEALNISDLGKLYNKKQYPVISSFSCSVGKFDQPGAECLAGALVKLEGAGAIVSIASSRTSTGPQNTQFAFNFYNQLISSNNQMQSIGVMIVQGKILAMDPGNNRRYVVLGDPSIRLVQSIRKISIDIVNTADSSLSEIKSMQLVKIKGNILNSSGIIDNEYGNDVKPAFVQIGLFNPDDSTSRKDRGESDRRYVLPGSPVFHGKTKVIHGQFEQAVLIPRNVVFNKTGVKLTAYSWCEGKNDCGSGYRTGFVFKGSADGVANDTTGPAVSIQHYEMKNDQTAYSSCKILSLQLTLYDPNGVDLIGTGPDEGLALEIPGLLAKRSISNNFQFKEGDFKSGTAALEIPLQMVTDDRYELVVTSRDLMGNLSVTTFPLDLKKNSISEIQQDPDLDHTFNFPNPVSLGSTTRFFFSGSEANQRIIPYHYRFIIKIYTLNGKLIRVYKDARNGELWDCRDQRGTLLSPDTYLYQVQAFSLLKKKTIKGKIEKIVIHPPR